MKLLGREVGFLRTVEAVCRVVEEMDGGDAEKGISAIFSKDYMEAQKASVQFIVIMSAGYELRKHVEDPGYIMRPITREEVNAMTEKEMTAALLEAVKAWNGEQPTIETEPAKKKEKPKGEKSS